jgi:putative sterol carrier protein
VPAESVSEFFDSLTSVDASKTAGMHNSYLFEVEGAGSWLVTVQDGSIGVTQGDGGDPDCTISATEENFMKIVRGEQNPTTAYMTGKLKIKGDMGAAMKLQKLF